MVISFAHVLCVARVIGEVIQTPSSQKLTVSPLKLETMRHVGEYTELRNSSQIRHSSSIVVDQRSRRRRQTSVLVCRKVQ